LLLLGTTVLGTEFLARAVLELLILVLLFVLSVLSILPLLLLLSCELLLYRAVGHYLSLRLAQLVLAVTLVWVVRYLFFAVVVVVIAVCVQGHTHV